MKILSSLSLLLSALCVGCSDNAELKSIELRTLNLSSSMEERLGKLESALIKFSSEITTKVDSKEDKERTIELDPTEPRPRLILTDVGRFFIKCTKADRQLDGYNVRLEIGNSQGADFAGSIAISWGKYITNVNFGEGERYKVAMWEHSKTFELTSPLKSGFWNPVNLTLAPAKTSDLRPLEIRLLIDNVFLIAPTNNSGY